MGRSDAPQEQDDYVYEWVGDRDNGLAHLSWAGWGYDYSICGIQLWAASQKKADDRVRCTICIDINEGNLDGTELL
jgi:hypothetical protein